MGRARRWKRGDELLERKVMNNTLALRLDAVKRAFNRNETVMGEIFVTDGRGMLVATTDRTSDFYQGDEEWWRKAHNGSFVSVERDRSVGGISMTIAVPIRHEDRVVGVLKAVETMKDVEEEVSIRGNMTGRFFYLVDGSRLLLTNAPENRSDLTHAFSLSNGEGVFTAVSPVTGRRTLFTAVPVKVGEQRMRLVVEFDRGSWLDARIDILRISLIQVVVFVVLFMGLILLSDRRVFRPIARLTDELKRLSRGETDVEIDEDLLERKDELGELSRAFERLMTSMKLAMDNNTPQGLREEVKDLKEKVRMLEPALNELPIGVLLTDPHEEDNPIVYAGDGFLRLTGYDEDEVVGRNCRFLQGEETDEETVQEIAEAIDAREPITTVITNYRKSGEAFENLLHIRPVMKDGGLEYFLGVQIDISSFEQIEVAGED
ncbi:MAG: PAS domain-containing protein [Candidatus Nanohaloarchaea archaeon]|nr:PAS domain-containing protein [Candidatus Nanohaloarchaea archaeon]